jgi:hypothetical protein
VVGHAAEEPPPLGLVSLDGAVAGGPLADRVALLVALPEWYVRPPPSPCDCPWGI